MQSTHQSHERAPEAEGMHGPEVVTSRAPRELPADFFTQQRVNGLSSQQDLNYSLGGGHHRTPRFQQGAQPPAPEPSRTRTSSDSYPPPAPFNMGTLHAALPHERDPNAGSASQWSQSQPQYPHAPAPGGYGYGYGYSHQYPPSTVQQNGPPSGYGYHDPQRGFNQGAAYGSRPYYSQSAGGYHYG
jgi:hypothetical protein